MITKTTTLREAQNAPGQLQFMARIGDGAFMPHQAASSADLLHLLIDPADGRRIQIMTREAWLMKYSDAARQRAADDRALRDQIAFESNNRSAS